MSQLATGSDDNLGEGTLLEPCHLSARRGCLLLPWKIKNSLIPTEAVSPKPVSARPSGTEISQDSAPAGTDLQRVLFPSLGWKASQPPASVLGILSVKLFLWALTVTIPSAHSSWHS